jgi:hypothetical protein
MLSEILNNSNLVIGVVSTRYNSSMLSYLRFLAKSHGFNSKSIKRIEKVEQITKDYQFLVKGPTMLFYNKFKADLQFMDKLKNFADINIIFVSNYGYIFLTDNLNSLKSTNEYNANINSSIYNVLCNINITPIYLNLIILIDAYSKSVIKRS